jgi:hypothetical protein
MLTKYQDDHRSITTSSKKCLNFKFYIKTKFGVCVKNKEDVHSNGGIFKIYRGIQILVNIYIYI